MKNTVNWTVIRRIEIGPDVSNVVGDSMASSEAACHI